MNRTPPAIQAIDRIGLLCAGVAAVGFSGKAILVKLAYRHGVDPVSYTHLDVYKRQAQDRGYSSELQ